MPIALRESSSYSSYISSSLSVSHSYSSSSVSISKLDISKSVSDVSEVEARQKPSDSHDPNTNLPATIISTNADQARPTTELNDLTTPQLLLKPNHEAAGELLPEKTVKKPENS